MLDNEKLFKILRPIALSKHPLKIHTLDFSNNKIEFNDAVTEAISQIMAKSNGHRKAKVLKF
jgi:Leucine-rich repeat (LRR) protein